MPPPYTPADRLQDFTTALHEIYHVATAHFYSMRTVDCRIAPGGFGESGIVLEILPEDIEKRYADSPFQSYKAVARCLAVAMAPSIALHQPLAGTDKLRVMLYRVNWPAKSSITWEAVVKEAKSMIWWSNVHKPQSLLRSRLTSELLRERSLNQAQLDEILSPAPLVARPTTSATPNVLPVSQHWPRLNVMHPTNFGARIYA